jgi:hypothetical protein
MATWGKIGRIVGEAARNPSVQRALRSPQAKQLGGRAVDGAAALPRKAARGKHQVTIQRARDEAIRRLGRPS